MQEERNQEEYMERSVGVAESDLRNVIDAFEASMVYFEDELSEFEPLSDGEGEQKVEEGGVGSKKTYAEIALKVVELIAQFLGCLALFYSDLSDPFLVKIGLTFFTFGWILSKVPNTLFSQKVLGNALFYTLDRMHPPQRSPAGEFGLEEKRACRRKMYLIMRELQSLKLLLANSRLDLQVGHVSGDSSDDDSGGVDDSPYPDSDSDC